MQKKWENGKFRKIKLSKKKRQRMQLAYFPHLQIQQNTNEPTLRPPDSFKLKVVSHFSSFPLLFCIPSLPYGYQRASYDRGHRTLGGHRKSAQHATYDRKVATEMARLQPITGAVKGPCVATGPR